MADFVDRYIVEDKSSGAVKGIAAAQDALAASNEKLAKSVERSSRTLEALEKRYDPQTLLAIKTTAAIEEYERTVRKLNQAVAENAEYADKAAQIMAGAAAKRDALIARAQKQAAELAAATAAAQPETDFAVAATALSRYVEQFDPAAKAQRLYSEEVARATSLLDAASASEEERARVLAQVAAAYDPAVKAARDASRAAEENAAAMAALAGSYDPALKAQQRYQQEIERATGILDTAKASEEDRARILAQVAAAHDPAIKAQRDAAAAAEENAAALTRLIGSLDPAEKAQQVYQQKVAEATAILDANRSSEEERARVLGLVAAAYDPVTRASIAAAEAAEKEAAALRQMAEEARAAAAAFQAQQRYNGEYAPGLMPPTFDTGGTGAQLTGIGRAAQSATILEPLLAEMERVEREAEQSAAALTRLMGRLDPLAAATEKYQQELVQLRAAQAAGRLTSEQLAAAENKLQAEFQQSKAWIEATHGSGITGFKSVGQAAQQAGYQLQDFFIQVAGGQNVIIAFTQQASQMLGFFGAGGAMIGAGLAIGGLVANMLLLGDATETATDKMDDANKSMERYTELLELANKLQGEGASLARARAAEERTLAFQRAREAVQAAEDTLQFRRNRAAEADQLEKVYGNIPGLGAAFSAIWTGIFNKGSVDAARRDRDDASISLSKLGQEGGKTAPVLEELNRLYDELGDQRDWIDATAQGTMAQQALARQLAITTAQARAFKAATDDLFKDGVWTPQDEQERARLVREAGLQAGAEFAAKTPLVTSFDTTATEEYLSFLDKLADESAWIEAARQGEAAVRALNREMAVGEARAEAYRKATAALGSDGELTAGEVAERARLMDDAGRQAAAAFDLRNPVTNSTRVLDEFKDRVEDVTRFLADQNDGVTALERAYQPFATKVEVLTDLQDKLSRAGRQGVSVTKELAAVEKLLADVRVAGAEAQKRAQEEIDRQVQQRGAEVQQIETRTQKLRDVIEGRASKADLRRFDDQQRVDAQVAQRQKELNDLKKQGANIDVDADLARFRAALTVHAEVERVAETVIKADDLINDTLRQSLEDVGDGLVTSLMRGENAFKSLANVGLQTVDALASAFLKLAVINPLINSIGLSGDALLPTMKFAAGGWTGGGARDDVAGVVHGQEFVVKAPYAEQNRALLEALNRGAGAAAVEAYAPDAPTPVAFPRAANINVPPTVFVIEDHRGAGTPPVERRERTRADGTREIRAIIRAESKAALTEALNGGGADSDMRRNYGLTRAPIRR